MTLSATSPQSIKDLEALASWGASVSLTVKPGRSYSASEDEPGKAHTVRLYAVFKGTADGQDFSFEKTYARGHKPDCIKTVRHAVGMANTRLRSDLRHLQDAGAHARADLFSVEQVLTSSPGCDACAGLPQKPGSLDQAMRLARLGHTVRAHVAADCAAGVPEPGSCRLVARFGFSGRGGDGAQEKTYGVITREDLARGAEPPVLATANRMLALDLAMLRRAGISVPAASFEPDRIRFAMSLAQSGADAASHAWPRIMSAS